MTMNHLDSPTTSLLSLDPSPADAELRHAQAEVADERPWLARTPVGPALALAVYAGRRAIRAAGRWSDRLVWLAIAVTAAILGAHAACSGEARSDRYIIGPDPEVRPLTPKPDATRFADREDAGPLVAMARL